MGVSFLERIRAWWDRDKIEVAREETRMTPGERDVAEEDYEARKDDARLRGGWIYGGGADYESDSEPPRH